jgi:hypothetical protein
MTEDSSPTPISITIPAVGALLFAGTVAGLVCHVPSPHSLSWTHLIGSAGLYVAISATAGSLAVWSIRAIFREHITVALRPLRWCIVCSAAWVPLLCLLLRENSIWSVFIPSLVIVHPARFLKKQSYGIKHQGTADFDQADTQKLFQASESISLLRSMLPAVVASVAFQAGLGAFLLDHSVTAALFFAVCTTIVVWSYPLRSRFQGSSRESQPDRNLGFVPLFATLLTAIALTPFLRDVSVAARFHSLLEGNPKTDRMSVRDVRLSLQSPSSSYSGVILLAPPKAHRKLVSDPPMKHSKLMGRFTKPVIIPFDGAYWYFKRPDPRPKPDARVVRGNPTKENVSSNDWTPISMEAHQHLGTSLYTDCCSEIRVAIQNADNRGGMISLEVLLRDTGAVGTPAQPLGSLVIPSSEARRIALNRPPVNEVLAFPIPTKVRGRRFDEITVRIKPAKERSLAGPQVAIQEFLLVP